MKYVAKYRDLLKARTKSMSAFARYYILIMILVFILLSLFSLYIYYMSYENFSEQQTLTEQGVLNQAIAKMDNTFYFINQLAATTSNNSDMINLGISPSLENRQRNFSIITTLRNMVAENTYLKKAFLYEHTKGYLITSDSIITTIEGSKESATILYCLSSKNAITLEEESNRFSSRLVQDGQKLYFVYDFVYSSTGPLNTLIFELDKEMLFTSFLSSLSLENYHLTVKGTKKNAIFTTSEDSTTEYTGSGTTLSATSTYTHWTYLLYPQSILQFSILQNNSLFILFVLLLLFVSMLLTYFITCKAYAPIKNLMQLVSPDTAQANGDAKTDINEFTHLENSYQKLLSDNQLAACMIEEAQPELEQKLFSNILRGMEYTRQELEQQLLTLHSSFRTDEKYQVILLQTCNITGIDPLSQHIYARRLSQLSIQLFDPQWGSIQFLHPNDRECVLIIQYPSECSITQIGRFVRSFQADFEKHANSSSLNFIFAPGKIYYGLPQILQSYKDASEQLRYQLYCNNNVKPDQVPTAGTISREYFMSLIRQMVLKLEKSDTYFATELLRQLLDELFESDLDCSSVRELCEQILDSLVEKALYYRPSKESSHMSPDYPSLYKKLHDATQKEELYALMQEETEHLLQSIHTGSQKRQHRLIAWAKEYIATNYRNCNLSLDEIAQDVGCTPSYLSNIFTEFTRENLVTYLNTYRINMAKDLLINSQILIKDIGYKTGFNTIQNFNRVFKKTTGMTPNEYRKTYQNI